MAKQLVREPETQDPDLHDHDFYSWCLRQAELVRKGRFAELDISNVVEELESLGGEQVNKLESSYRVLLLHLLKWRYQPNRRTRSWRLSIGRERVNVPRVLRKNPGLKPQRADRFADAYVDARKLAALETDLPLSTFPETCPFTLDEATDEDFWPLPG